MSDTSRRTVFSNQIYFISKNIILDYDHPVQQNFASVANITKNKCKYWVSDTVLSLCRTLLVRVSFPTYFIIYPKTLFQTTTDLFSRILQVVNITEIKSENYVSDTIISLCRTLVVGLSFQTKFISNLKFLSQTTTILFSRILQVQPK